MTSVRTSPKSTLMEGHRLSLKLIAVVTVNWNSWRDTLDVHRSLLGSTLDNWHLIVVDNASTDQSANRLIDADLLRTTIIRHPVNAGFAGGCNVGIREATAIGASHVFLLNNDATVAPDCLKRLLTASENLRDRTILGPIVKYWEGGNIQFMGSARSKVYGHPTWKTGAVESLVDEEGFIPSDFIFGAALFSPTALFADDAVGKFDERFFLNFEETDWCYRAATLDIPCRVVPAAQVIHRSSASLGTILGPLQRYFLTRNELLFAELHATTGERWRVTKRSLGDVVRRVLRGWRRRSRLDPADRATLLGLRDYIGRRFGDCPPSVRKLAQHWQAEPSS